MACEMAARDSVGMDAAMARSRPEVRNAGTSFHVEGCGDVSRAVSFHVSTSLDLAWALTFTLTTHG